MLSRAIARIKWWWYKFYCAWVHRYNTVVCPHLTPTWNDRDYLLLHCSFQILTDFIEGEKPWQFDLPYDRLYLLYRESGLSHEESIARAVEWENLTRLYHWWKQRGPQTNTRMTYESDSKQLIKLIACRGRLWT